MTAKATTAPKVTIVSEIETTRTVNVDNSQDETRAYDMQAQVVFVNGKLSAVNNGVVTDKETSKRLVEFNRRNYGSTFTVVDPTLATATCEAIYSQVNAFIENAKSYES